MTKSNKIDKNIIKLINHEAWIEVDERAYVMWGHYPKVDGRLDPSKIRRAFAVYNCTFLPVVIGIDRESSERGGLFLEFERADSIAIEYDAGVYTLTEDNKWVFGKICDPKYKIKETRWILGFASVHLRNPKPLGLELEIVPSDVKGKVVEVELLFRGKPTSGNLKVSNSEGTFEVEINGKAEIEVAKGVNVISARYIDKLAFGVDKRHLVTTLTILVK